MSQENPRVALFVAPGLEEIEGLTVVDILFRAGIACDTIAVAEERTITSSHKVTIVCDRCITDADFDFDAYDMLVLPGGIPGTPNLAACKPLTDAVVRFAKAGKEVAAICAAPTILAGLGLLEGKCATCFPSRTDELVEHGAILAPGSVVRDGNIMTSRGMGTAIDFSLAIVEHYQGREKADTLASAIVYC